ncbi:class I SAM-dependent methyltransferase [Salipiger sp. H15]|uniref:Class I SAM-dependent methyltransferase n=1 Tax=Alloyangia sp. H15 TaxID=3029062 RepID=A0AAU8ALS2_9RHOB
MVSAVEQRAQAILRRLPEVARMAEIGVLVGRLSEAVLRARPGLNLTMVDSWAPMDRQPAAYIATGDEHARHDTARVQRHRSEAERRVRPFRKRTTIFAMSSIEAATQVEDASLDLVFLDGDHSELGVLSDIEAWLPKVRAGGWIGGHDIDNDDPRYDFSGVRRAVEARFGTFEVDQNFTWWVRL